MDKPRLMVALQEFEHVDSLVRLACEMSQGTLHEVIALHVVEVPASLPLDSGDGVLDRQGCKLLAEAQRVARHRFGEEITTRLVRGRDAAHVIVREAQEHKIELLIMGYRQKKSHLAKALMGSTVQYVVEHAPCRVIVEALAIDLPELTVA